jgi:small subunit ribosomal protein S2
VPLVTVQELIDAGVHLGHQASRWNPRMRPFIYGKRHKIHIINLQETIRGLFQACHFLQRLAATGQQILFLGTKRQIRAVVESEARRCGMPAVTERWIGGTLTNFATVRERLSRLEELEAMEADGTLEKLKKKEQATLRREMRKIRRNLEGVRDLHGLPGAMVVVDPRREEICIREATRMNVPVVCVLDTDCDPEPVDIPIPANDDAMSSVQLLLTRIADAIREGRAAVDEQTIAQMAKQAADDVRAREPQGRRMTPAGAGAGGDRGPRRAPGGPRRESGPGGPRREGPAGGRLTRRSTGRFADRAGGHADSISLGDERREPDSGEATAGEATGGESAAGEAAPGSSAPEERVPGAGGQTAGGGGQPAGGEGAPQGNP